MSVQSASNESSLDTYIHGLLLHDGWMCNNFKPLDFYYYGCIHSFGELFCYKADSNSCNTRYPQYKVKQAVTASVFRVFSFFSFDERVL
mmetsp:Transcript_28393/g.41844  ORF Transcript_28393/g.41844 Transcript_28393/m.41844 type:complete len:89 (+) Transcript_28393:348-614(+)